VILLEDAQKAKKESVKTHKETRSFLVFLQFESKYQKKNPRNLRNL